LRPARFLLVDVDVGCGIATVAIAVECPIVGLAIGDLEPLVAVD